MEAQKNQYEILFDEMLLQLDIDLVKYGKNAYRIFSTYRIIDDQTVLQNTDEIFAALENEIDDSFAGDLDREAIAYGCRNFIAHSWDELLVCIDHYKSPFASEQERKFIEDHEWEIKVIEMLTNHLDEVDINHLDFKESDAQVFYVEVRETYRKIVRVIAFDSGEACERAMQALNEGDIQCDEYKESSSDVEVCNRKEVEEYYCEDVSDITLINEEGEVE